jgi:predicted amidohydrolase YtcJ
LIDSHNHFVRAGKRWLVDMHWESAHSVVEALNTLRRARATLSEENLLSRQEALRGYTLGSAWFSFEETERGSLEPGKIADLVVLSGDYFTVPSSKSGICAAR